MKNNRKAHGKTKELRKSSAMPSHLIYKILIAFSALLLYISSTGYEYTMDDDIFFLKHESVQKGFSGIGEIFTHGSMEKFDNTKGVQAYRPVHLLFFAIEKQLFGENPVVSHFINVLLYVLMALVLFNVLRILFKNNSTELSFLITLLFIVHPLHTEVVASVKSRDEIWAGLFGLLAWQSYLNWMDGSKRTEILKGLCWFTLASFSKESTISWLAIFPLGAVMFCDKKVLQSITSVLPFAVVSIVYVVIRLVIVGTKTDYFGIPILANILTGANGFSEVWGTKLELLWYYLKLLILPWPLSWDYSYNEIPVMSLSHPLPWISMVLHAGLLAFAVFRFRKQPIISFAILFFLVMMAPTNNFFIYNTTTLGERLMFVPSLSVCLALVFIAGKLTKTDWKLSAPLLQNNSIKILFPVILIFSVMTISRSADWKNNISLFKSGVEVCPNSSRTNYSLASEYFKQAQKTGNDQLKKEYLQKAGQLFQRSVEILPENYQAYYNYALYCGAIGDTASAIKNYSTVLSLKPEYIEALNNLGVLYTSQHNFKLAYPCYRKAYDINPQAPAAASNLGNMFFNQGIQFAMEGKSDSAIISYRQSLQYVPGNVMPLNNIASTFASMNKFDSCLVYLKKGYAVEPANLMILENIGAVSFLNKEYEQGIEYAGKALSINPQLTKSINTMINCYTAKGDASTASKYRAMLLSK